MPDLIDLSLIPPPDALVPLDFEGVLAEDTADYASRLPADAEPLLESDPAAKVLETGAYRELLRRSQVNDAVRAVMLASATGRDLEHLAALYGVYRLVITRADPTASPPVEAVYESDDNLRLRAQLAPEGFSVAGPRRAYEKHARDASPLLRHVRAFSPSPSVMRVTLLSTAPDGAVGQELIDTVIAALSDEDVRPAGDRVIVQAAEVITYTVNAQLIIPPGPDGAVVRELARTAVQLYAAGRFAIGEDIPILGLSAALVVPGVDGGTLTTPAADVVVSDVQAARLIDLTIQ